jgi:hypothetical protein
LFQDQATQLWEAISAHYKGSPVVCGNNLLNEPAHPEHTRLISWYERAEKATRAVNLLFIDGNTYDMEFTRFETVLPNLVHAMHDYATLIFPIPGQAPYSDQEADKTNDARFEMLREQLNIYHQVRIS